nr:probable LRR receptor-like serine/threonine-protein kinase At3g47570 [Coffea arabica]
MEKLSYHFLQGLFFLLYYVSASLAMTTTNITTDQDALLALRAHITVQDPHQILLENWSVSSPVCQWVGVTCGSRHRRVIALDLSNMNLSGIIPPQLGNMSFLVSLNMSRNNFHGELPHEFARLRRLRVLDLDANNLGGEFPEWFGSFHQLRLLSLNNNSFTGFISTSLANVSTLETLSLSFNYLQGNIPTEIFKISSLELIFFQGNSLSGSVPDDMCRHLQRIQRIDLSGNNLNGQIPSSTYNCSQLQLLDLSSNHFTGFIPKEIGTLKALERLYLYRNSLEGEIPKEMGNLTVLKILGVGGNHITGAIPQEISKLWNLEQLDLEGNNLTGFIPMQIFNLSQIRILSLTGNQLSGNLPSKMDNGLPNVEELYLNSNNLGGPIPDSISNCSKLKILELSANNFTGPIPHYFGDLRHLEFLDLSGNNLMSDYSSSNTQLGWINSLANCKHLTVLGVADNPMTGFLPNSIGNLSTLLEQFYAYNCDLRGSIPDEIGNLSSLTTLSMYSNQLSGMLPITMKNLEKLQGIDLQDNKLSKTSLDYLCVLQNLAVLYLGGNQISGSLPECIGNVTSLRYLYLGSNLLNSSLPTTIWNLKDLLELDLSSNSLSGTLPPEIRNLKAAILIDLSINEISSSIPSSIGDLVNLQNLSLAYNRLQGSIPESIVTTLSLEWLDLSHNYLTGVIPMSLSNLRYLVHFNVSYNNLSGEIPSRGPFTNFTGESFISNEALCGAPRFHVPTCPGISGGRLRTKKLRRTISVALGAFISVAVAIFLGFIYLRRAKKEQVASAGVLSSVATQERISYYKLLQATDGYDESNLLGTGSFGSVYKGTLDDGRIVAVKVFKLQQEGAFNSFDAECEVLRSLRHRNLTKVISSCSNEDFKALVLEFMSNGSLEKWLYSHNYFLEIKQRLDILIDVACALQYLHYGLSTPVVHCDVKPSNVLLDQDMVAHVTDFGVAKLLGHEDSFTYTKTLATLGYLAPEYGLEGQVSTKCDVYSFGIMIMEVFTRKSPNDKMFGENLSLKSWVSDSMPDGLVRVVDANLLKPNHEKLDCISSIMKVALNCTKESSRERSNVHEVLADLKKIKIQLLPCSN